MVGLSSLFHWNRPDNPLCHSSHLTLGLFFCPAARYCFISGPFIMRYFALKRFSSISFSGFPVVTSANEEMVVCL